MKVFQASTTINAPADRIWAILTDGAAYPQWEPNTIRIEGTIAPGARLTAYSKLSPERAFPVKVATFVPNQAMTWVGGMPLGLFTGERSFTLTPQGDGSIAFTLQEAFRGPLLGLIAGTLPDLNTAFAQFAAALKARAEVAA